MRRISFIALGICFLSISNLAAQNQPSFEDYLKIKAQNEALAPIDRIVREQLLAGKAIRLADGRVVSPYKLEHGRPKFREDLVVAAALRDLSFAIGTQADELWPGGSSGYDVSGKDVIVGVWEFGHPNTAHLTFADAMGVTRMTLGDVPPDPAVFSSHAMDVNSIVGSKGDPSPDLKSMAFEVSYWNYDADEDNDEIEAAAAAGIIASNHSYGDITGWTGWRLDPDGSGGPEPARYRWMGNPSVDETEDYHFGFYDRNSAYYDSLAYRNKFYSMVAAVGNDRGTGVLTDTHYVFTGTGPFEGGWEQSETPRQADNDWLGGFDTVLPGFQSSKNVISVGALTNDNAIACRFRPDDEPYVSAYYSDWGPTDDGRIKPDFSAPAMAFYRPVHTSISGFNCAGAAGGTSYAAPIIVGGLALLAEHQENLNPGVMRRASTYKALMAHTAKDRNRPGPDYSTGWGMPQFRELADIMTADANGGGEYQIFEKTLAGGASHVISVVSDGTPLRATVAWTDPEGISLWTSDGTPDPTWLDNPTPLLVNDLDLVVIDSNLGPDYFYPWKLDPSSPLTDATRPSSSSEMAANTNVVDVMEQVLIDNPVAGRTYQIRVNHKGSLSNPITPNTQDYSLVFSGGKIARLSLDLKLFLSGPYAAGSMTTSLNSSGILQASASKNPYTAAPWNYSGADSVGTGFFAAQAGVVDWVIVQLLTGDPSTPPMTVVNRAVGMVLSDGSVKSIDGTSNLGLSPIPGSYYISVGHRNHLSILSSSAVDFSSGSASYDFTDSISKAFTGGGMAMRDMGASKFAMWGGDGEKDESISAFDFTNSWLPLNGGPAAYNQGDFDMNGTVTAFDYLNVFLPANGQLSQLP